MVGGLDGERLRQQAAEIARLNQHYADQGLDFRLLRGTEVEILADGSLGLPDEVSANLDIGGCQHSQWVTPGTGHHYRALS